MTNGNAPLSSDLVDPLAGYEGIALFPLTFGSQSDAGDLDAVHNHLKSMALRSPSKLLKQAKTIVDGSSELLNSQVSSDTPSQDDKDVIDTNDDEIQRDRRPGLGRKRARFSLKPNSSQPTVSLEPNLDIKDPEEFFMAYERHENAKREMQKQMGGTFMDSNQQNPSTKPRQRRPGILGSNRRPVTYKHFQSSVLSDGNDAPITSQETFEQDILSPTQSLDQGISCPNIASHSQELDGSISKREKSVDGLLDELLSTSCEDLDGDGAFAILQEHLQIKPIVLEKLSLPDLQNIRRNDRKALDGKSPKPRKVLVDMQNWLGGATSKLPAKYTEETLMQNKGSPTPSKSPFASILALKKHILHQSDPLGDRYSFSAVDISPGRNASPLDRSMEQSDPNITLKGPCNHSEMKSLRMVKSGDEIHMCSSSELKSLRTEEGNNTVAEPCTPEVTVRDSPDQIGKSGDDDPNRISFSNYFASKSHVDLEDQIGASGINEGGMNEKLSTPDANVDLQTEKVGDVPEAGAPSVEELNRTAEHLDQSSLAASENHTNGGPSKSVDIGVEHQPEKNQEPDSTSKNERSKSKRHPMKGHKRKHLSPMQNLDGESMSCEQESLEASRRPLDAQTKAKLIPHRVRKRKDSSKRQSLAGAGTKWDEGVRRSTRFRTRPLEYWKGERLLYGRIHNSMSTVIGMKYVSPAKGDGNPTIKVKQIVSDEYKELVDRAAWH